MQIVGFPMWRFISFCTTRFTPSICSVLQLWDSRKKGVLQTFQNTYQVTAVTLSDTAEQVISGGIDNDIKVR